MKNQGPSPFESLLDEARSSEKNTEFARQKRRLIRANGMLWAIWFLMMMGNLAQDAYEESPFNYELLLGGSVIGLLIGPFLMALSVGILAMLFGLIPGTPERPYRDRVTRTFLILLVIVQIIVVLFFLILLFS